MKATKRKNDVNSIKESITRAQGKQLGIHGLKHWAARAHLRLLVEISIYRLHETNHNMEYTGAITLLWKLGEEILKLANRAQLIVTEIYAHDFRPGIESGSYSRFIIAKVTNNGGRSANNCLAQLIIDDNEHEFKLHWCGESWEYKRDSAPKINLEPTESRDLDIAFSICGHMTTPPQPEGMSVTLPPIFPDSSSGKKGAWVATPFVTKNFNPDSPTYLSSGRHGVEIRIVLGAGSGFTFTFDILSSEDPAELTIDKDSVKYYY